MKKRYTYNRLSGTDIVVNESMRGVLEKLNWTCASTQEANPTPDAPKPIYSSGDGGKISVWSHKKNMFDKTVVTENYRLGSTGDLFGDSSYSTSGYLPVKPSSYYSFNALAGSECVCVYDSNKVFINRVIFNAVKKLTTASNGYFVRIAVYKTNLNKFQFELGATNTTYEPYTGSTTDINLPVGYVGGSLPNGVADTDTQKKIGKVTGVNGTSITINDMKSNGSFCSSVGGTISGTTITFASSVTNATIIYELATQVDITITKPPVSTYEGANTITTTNNIKPSLTIEAWKK